MFIKIMYEIEDFLDFKNYYIPFRSFRVFSIDRIHIWLFSPGAKIEEKEEISDSDSCEGIWLFSLH